MSRSPNRTCSASIARRASTPGTICRFRPSNRSEEHTSELQSLRHLVCRLLLEKNEVVAHLGGIEFEVIIRIDEADHRRHAKSFFFKMRGPRNFKFFFIRPPADL